MFRKLFFTSAFTIIILSLNAQHPENVSIKGLLAKSRQKLACTNDAGTISFGLHTGQSNSVMPDTIYLCFGDQIEVLHNPGTSDLSGDPDPTTPPGIVYPFYNCPPTLGSTGPLLSDILADNCLDNTSPITLNGMDVFQTDSIWIEAGDINGDVEFVNDGTIQTAFNNGGPIMFFYAPMTIDDFENREFEPDSTGMAGNCVNINASETFAIVYLNAIQESNVNNNAGDNGCSGSFIVSGGLPEFDGSTRFQVDIALTSDPSITGRLTSVRPGNDDMVEFFVPQPGEYTITVEDGVSCGHQFTIDMAGCEAVSFDIGEANALPGDTVCIDVSVSNFIDILSFQGELGWDTDFFELVELRNINPSLLGLDTISTISFDREEGFITWSWFNPSLTGFSLPDPSNLFQICFRAIGPLGQNTDLTFNPQVFELIKGANDQLLGFILNNGGINIAPGNLFVDYTLDSIQCFGDNNGGFSLSVAGGNTPYQVNWTQLEAVVPRTGNGTIDTDGNSLSFTGLPGGNYEITISDASNPVEVRIDTIEIFSPPSLGINLVNTLPRCAGESTGSIQTELIVGGQIINDPGTEYTFQWTSTNMNVGSLDNITSGFYGVTVSDTRGCQAVASTTLADPPQLDANPIIGPASCPGVADGDISIDPDGGTSPYNFSWQTGLETFNGTFETSNPTDIGSGTYGVTITDQNGCEITRSVTVGNAKNLDVNSVINDISCNGFNDGSILITGTSNIPEPPYNFTWENEGSLPTPPDNTTTTSELNNLSPGTYTVTLTDSGPAACAFVTSFTVEEPDVLDVSTLSQTIESCIPGSDAEAIVGVTGGTFPYTYNWSNNDTDSIASNLIAGEYQVIVTDNNNCEDSVSVIITQFTPPVITSLEDFTLACPGDVDGTLMVSAQPSGSNIQGFSWSNGQSTSTITDLSEGTYIVTVTAEDGCISIDTAMVIAPSAVIIEDVIPTLPSCAGDADGSLTVQATGGTMPYRYIWANTPQNDTLTFNLYPNLSAGTYNLTVVDGNNCSSATSSPVLPDAPAIQVSYTDPVEVSCRDLNCDGEITASANYSDLTTGNFTFRWETGEVTENQASSRAVRLCAGFQQITITDVNGCFLVDSVDVPAPPSIEVEINGSPASCNGFADGVAEVNVTGGVPPYRYNWASGETTNIITGLPAGTYSVIILDNNDCISSQQVDVVEPDPLDLTLDLDLTQDIQCNGEMNGVIAVSINDSTAINPLRTSPYTWSDNIAAADTNVAVNLSAGTYGVTVTDVEGCQDSLSYTITEPTPIVADIPAPAPPRCFGDFTEIVINNISGGNGVALGDYIYFVGESGLGFSPDQPAEVRAGSYLITIEDPQGCTFTTTVNIVEPERIQVAFSPDEIEIELGDTTQRLQPIISSSLPIDSFAWSPGDFLSAIDIQRPLVTPLDDRQYTLRVVDVNGCDAEGTITVEVDRNRNVFIPNIFTPNGEGNGLNEEFRIFACNGVENINFVRLYDRWGNMMVDRSNLGPACEGGIPVWDGRFRGNRMNPGVYVYLVEVEFVDGVTLLYRGDVTLIR